MLSIYKQLLHNGTQLLILVSTHTHTLIVQARLQDNYDNNFFLSLVLANNTESFGRHHLTTPQLSCHTLQQFMLRSLALHFTFYNFTYDNYYSPIRVCADFFYNSTTSSAVHCHIRSHLIFRRRTHLCDINFIGDDSAKLINRDAVG
jgi:hypothetical protein